MPASPERATAVWVPTMAVFFLTAWLMWSIGHPGAAISPLLSYFFIVVLAVRHRHLSAMRALFFPATVVFVLWFFSQVQQITLPLGIALLISYLLDPLVDRLEGRVGRTRAVLLLALPALLLLGLFVVFVVPAILGELGDLLHKLPELREPLGRAQAWLQDRAAQLGLDLSWASLTDFLVPRLESVGQTALGAGGRLWQGLKSLLDLLSLLVITPVVTFYLLRDFDRMREGFLRAMPEASHERVRSFFRRVDRAISAYLRGQLLVGLIQGTLFAVGLSLLGVQYAILVGICAVFLNLVPFVGSATTAILALSVALVSNPTWSSVLSVGLLYAVLQTLDAAFLSPRVVGGSVELHPVAVMIAILVGGAFFSVAGVLFAVPAAAVLRESLTLWTRQLLELLPGLGEDATQAES